MVKAVLFDVFETLVTLKTTPPYFGAQMARDAGADEGAFLSLWRETESARTLGALTFEQAVAGVLERCGASTGIIDLLAKKRRAAKTACFERLHEGILPMLTALRNKGIRLGLVSNCYLEEAPVIRQSALFPFFDAACLSCEEGVAKPAPEIFLRCASRLGASPRECLFVGDGGSDELRASSALGMQTLRAVWYSDTLPNDHDRAHPCADDPMAVFYVL